MNYNHIYKLSAKELYDEALVYKYAKNYNKYIIYMS